MPLEIGALLHGRYRVEEVLGRGGMGAVYLATDENLNLPCAVKENLNLSPEAERQFRREATLLAALRHPNLPRVTNHFVLGDQQYLVMDFVEGEDLQQRLKREGRLPEADVLEWAAQICGALTYLHRHDPPVIHRDIKPANIKLTPAGQVMLVDFGLAKAAQAGQKTTTGALGITSGFAPPEQYGAGSTDARTDEYALAATLYNLLTDRVPPDAMDRLVSTASLIPPEELRPDLAPHLAQALARALELKPGDRLADIETFQAALMGEIALQPKATTTTRPTRRPAPSEAEAPSEPLPTQRPRPRSGVLAFVSLTALAAVVVGGYFFLQGRGPTPNVTSVPQPTETRPSASATPTLAASSPTPAPPTGTPAPTVEATPGATSTPDLISVANAGDMRSLGGLPALAAGSSLFALSLDGSLVAIPSAQGVDIYHTATGQAAGQLQGFLRGREIQGLAFLSEALLIQMPDEILRWDLAENIFAPGFRIPGRKLVVSADGHLMALSDKYVSVFEIASGSLLHTIGSPNVDYYYQFSPDAQYLALTSGGPAVELWDMATGQLVDRLAGHGEPTGALVFNRDGSLLISASGDVWDVAGRSLFSTFDSSTDLVAISPDGQVIVGNDGSVWTASTGAQIGMLRGLEAAVAMAFTPDGRQLIWEFPGGKIDYLGVASGLAMAEVTPTAAGAAAAAPTREAIDLFNVSRLTGLAELGAGSYTGMALSPNGQTLAALSIAGVEFFDTATRQSKGQWRDQGRVTETAFVGDDFLLLVKAQGGVERWEIAPQKMKQSYDYAGRALAVSPDGRLFALQDKYIQIVEVASGKLIYSLGSANAPHSFGFTRDGRYLAVTSGTGVGLWDMSTGQRSLSLGGHGPNTTGLAFTSDGGRLIAASGDVWDLQQAGGLLAAFESAANLVAVSPDGRIILGNDGSAWDASNGQFLGVLSGAPSGVTQLAFTPNGQQVFWQTASGKIEAWALRATASTASIPEAKAASALETISLSNLSALALQGWWGTDQLLSIRLVRDEAGARIRPFGDQNYTWMTLRPGGKMLAGASSAGVDVIDLAAGAPAVRLRDFLNPDQIAEVAFAGDTVLALKAYGGVERWDLSTQTLKQRYNVAGQSLLVSPNERLFALQDRRAVLVVDAASGQVVHRLGPANPQHAYQFTPDSRYLAIANSESVGLWDMTTGQRERNLKGHTSRTSGLAFTQDGTQMIAASGDIWDVASERLLARFDSKATRIVVNPDGNLIVGDDGLLRDTSGGQVVGVLTEMRGRAVNLAFTPDGRQLLWQTGAGVVYVWAVSKAPAASAAVTPAPDAISSVNAGQLALQSWWGKGRLTGAQWSPDEKYLAVNTTQNAIIYDGATLKPVRNYWQALALAFDAAGRAAVADSEGVKIIVVASGEVKQTLTQPGVHAAAFSPDGKVLAVGGALVQPENPDGLGVINLSSGSLQMLDEGLGRYKGVAALAFTPDGKTLVASLQGAVSIWDLTAGKKVRATIANVVKPASLSPDGKYLVYLTNKVVVENLLTGGVLREINADGTPFFPSSHDVDPFRPLSYRLLSSNDLLMFYQRARERTMAIVQWDLQTGKAQVLADHFADLNRLAGLFTEVYAQDKSQRVPAFDLSPAGKRFYSLTEDGAARVWELATGQTSAATLPDFAADMALSLDGQAVVVLDALGGLRLVDLDSGEAKAIAGSWHPQRMAFVSKSVLLLIHGDGQLTYLDLEGGSAVEEVAGDYFREAAYFAASADHHLFGLWQTIRPRNFLNIFGYALEQPLHALGSYAKTDYFQFSPDGQTLALANGKNLEFWSTRTGQKLAGVASQRRTIGALVFSPNGRRLFTASGDIWDVTSQQVVASFESQAAALIVSPNGQVIAGDDGSVWDAASGKLIAMLAATGGRASHLAFTPDGRHLIWQTADGVIEVWGVKS